MSCKPFCSSNFWDHSCCHKPYLAGCHCKGECNCFGLTIKVATPKPTPPATPPAKASKAPSSPPAPKGGPPNPQCKFVVPIQRPKNPPPPAFDVDDNDMRFQVTMKWDMSRCPVKCDVTVENHTLLLIKASFATDKKDTFDVFERRVQIPPDTVAEKSEGKYKDGVLVVEIPKLDSWKRFYI
ncbi:hypothetical protein IWQ62_001275 [Dispira parvispora]|uniref:SHSP domain-containing protein n=1 Tax=Dispira parvispora TaxID=1520584 RepID=A0A9W8E549_9FUNG|nr:hypothetical protein IWQ62_001275 [Dispira parvispora]